MQGSRWADNGGPSGGSPEFVSPTLSAARFRSWAPRL